MVEYPDNILAQLRALQRQVAQLYSQATHSAPYGEMIAGQMVVGNPPPLRRIVLNPDTANVHDAEISLEPAGTSNPVRILADANINYDGEAILHAISSQGDDGDTELLMASGEVLMRVRDTGGNNDGGYARWGRDFARFGWTNESSSDNYFDFSASSLSRHIGRWGDFADQPANAGLLTGSVTVGGSSTSHTQSYPTTMDSKINPVIGLRLGSGSPNAKWAITAANNSQYTVQWDAAQSVEILQWAFRQ